MTMGRAENAQSPEALPGKSVYVRGAFDDLRSGDIRFLEEAGKLGSLHVFLDAEAPRFPLAEREYFVGAIRYVNHVSVLDPGFPDDQLPAGFRDGIWAMDKASDTLARRAFCQAHGMKCQILSSLDMAGFPVPTPLPPRPGKKRVLVTGCYDWFHTGHIRFFEEVFELGDLYVAIGNDENVRYFKGPDKPMFPGEERRYIAGSIRFVTQCLISSGIGSLDVEKEIAEIRPHIWAVNEDGDRPVKREFCEANGIEYVVLKRLPKEGLVARSSTSLRGG